MQKRVNRRSRAVALVFLTVIGSSAVAAPAVPRLDFYPPGVRLDHAADFQSFVVVATDAGGVSRDVTDQAEYTVRGEETFRVEGRVLRPTSDGRSELLVRHEDRTVTVPIVVGNARTTPSPSFRNDVMPIFMRAGCNAGGCHGAARGKDGFRLSLFGYDPAGDHYRLTREIPFRRINLARPEASLLLEKATGSVFHTGGKRFDVESDDYDAIYRWLAEGALDDGPQAPQVEEIEVFPRQAVLQGAAQTLPLVVRAKYSDGTDRDVSPLAVYLSNNDMSVAVDAAGELRAGQRGEAFVLARFDTKTVGVQIIVLPEELDYQAPDETPANYVDELVNAKLNKLRILPSEVCEDRVFLRRATIDIIGRLPTEKEYREFLADESPDKRRRLVESLVEKKEFAEIWAMKWAELLMIRSTNQVSYKSAYLYSSWLTDRIAGNQPLDEMVRDLLGSSGGTFGDPATNFYQIERDTLKTAENVAQVFMGLRIQCAQCHNHPFDRWTMDDYYGFAAFFCQVGRKTGEDYRETVVFNRGSGAVRHPVGNAVVPPKFLGGDQPDLQGQDRRVALAEWLTAPENPFFATSVANRIWAHFFGIGIVEPIDDMRVSNPPSNPELLDALAEALIRYDYDFKRLVRDICASNAYQRSTRRNESNATDDRNFAAGRVRRIQAEMLLDCVSQVTETQDKFKGLPLGARAVQIADGTTSNYFLTTFGRSSRASVDAHEVKTDPTLSQALHLLNGDTLHGKIRAGKVVPRMLEAGKTPAQIIGTLYIRCYGREPTTAERAELVAIVAAADDTQAALEDVFWALLNGREFCFNH